MTKKTRLIVLLVCVACFLVIAPILVLYSMGYRFDFEKMKITTIGGIYVNTNPKAEKIIIDNKIIKEPGILSNDVSFLNLLPKDHTVLVEKTGYYDYTKTISVQEKQVTKLENILLFKKNIQFSIVEDSSAFAKAMADKQDKFIIKNNNLYYSAVPANINISAIAKATPILKGLVAFSAVNNNVLWLGIDGLLYQSDLTNLTAKPLKVTLTAIKINKKGVYKIVINSQNTFVIANGGLFLLNTKTNNLDSFYSPAIDVKFSPDGNNIIYYNDNNIYLSPIPSAPTKKNVLYKSSAKISDCLWLNNNYVIFTDGDPEKNGASKIIISEIDTRGNTNIITLPQTIEKIDIKSPQIYFDQQTNKLYILTGDTLLLSEKLIP